VSIKDLKMCSLFKFSESRFLADFCQVVKILILIIVLTEGLVLLPGCKTEEEFAVRIPDEGWRLWPDVEAEWKEDEIYLPGEFELKNLPLNPPTGGWDALSPSQGIEVTLPSTVEEHFWGRFGFRDYKDEYWFEKEDNQVKNGNYLGVSWWWKQVKIPESFKDKLVLLRIRGARLLAEVYLNRQLVGYNIINEASFECDLSQAARFGEKNLLAIRITNPGGRMEWVDTRLLAWGKKSFQASHGFGGLDRGLVISAYDPVYIKDLWAANTSEPRRIIAHVLIKNKSNQEVKGRLRYEIADPEKRHRILVSENTDFSLGKSAEATLESPLNYEGARLWDIENPKLYLLRVRVESSASAAERWADNKEVQFGFRSFEAEGIGENAVLCLNGRRIRLISAISWGYWGKNGLWPTPELAEREVKAAKALGMNCIQFHRNVGKEEVLAAQDRLGLLRYMEPGGGQTALGEKFTMYAESPKEKIDNSGSGGEAITFAEKYMEEKILRMMHDFRSHPSLFMYCIQNEINPDLRNPHIFHLVRRMHQEDPSRIIILKSGVPPHNQVWMRPYEDKVYYDHGDGFSGWWDEHTVGGPGVWKDEMYKSAEDFTHRSINSREIVVWGEMLGAAVPDNHARMVREIKAGTGQSYDLKDHEEILEAYDKFLDRWDFRKAFRTSEDLFLDIGDKSYDFWGRVIETARLAEANDYFVISGWESTAIDDHSGLVDNLRGFKGNPELVRARLAPARPVIEPSSLVIEKGKPAEVDLYFLNETEDDFGRSLRLSLFDPGNKRKEIGIYPIPAKEKDRFVYPIARKVETPILDSEGEYRIVFEVVGHPKARSEENLLVIEPVARGIYPQRVGVLCQEPDFMKAVNSLPDVQSEDYQTGKDYNVLIASTRLLQGWTSIVEPVEIQGTDDDELFWTESWGYDENLEYTFYDLPKGKARVTLRFAEVTLSRPKARIFDVAINGKTVLKDFDIFATAGGKNIAIDRIFEAEAPEGTVKITIPRRTVNYGKFSAIKVEAGDKVIAVNCGGKPYRDKNGLLWDSYRQRINLDDSIMEKVRKGMGLLLLPDGPEATEAYAEFLGKAGAFDYKGRVGTVRAPWMGSWYFVRDHELFSSLPVNQAMKSFYQVPVDDSDGVLLEGKGVEVFVGFGRDHDRNVGAGGFRTRLGKGQVIFYSIPGMVSGMIGRSRGIHPLIARRLISNALLSFSK